jgi:hypothetical protein
MSVQTASSAGTRFAHRPLQLGGHVLGVEAEHGFKSTLVEIDEHVDDGLYSGPPRIAFPPLFCRSEVAALNSAELRGFTSRLTADDERGHRRLPSEEKAASILAEPLFPETER